MLAYHRGTVALDVAWAVARDVPSDVACAVAWAVARDVAWAVPWDVARDVAWAIAWAVARDAAWAVASDVALEIAWRHDAFVPTYNVPAQCPRDGRLFYQQIILCSSADNPFFLSSR